MSGDRVWLLRTPSHYRLILASNAPTPPAGNYSVSDVTAAVLELITLNPEWVREAQGGTV